MGRAGEPQPAGAEVVEAQRLDAVRRYEILDTLPDAAFDRIASLARRIFGVPIGIVSIVDVERIWFKAHVGVGASEVAREPGFCATTILSDDPLVVTDARADPLASSNSLVTGSAGIRFYAGAPLVSPDGYRLGTVCVMDTVPRDCTQSEGEILLDLARIVVDELELRLAARRTVAMQEELRRQSDRARALAEAAALIDPLTGIRNRRALEADLAVASNEAQASGADVGLVMIDVDGLKEVNDMYGHFRGDQLLRRFATALQDSFRTTDGLYRLGGDEFTIVLPLTSTSDLGAIENRVKAAVTATRKAGFPGMDASIGMASLTEAGWSRDDGLALADRRMYRQKASSAHLRHVRVAAIQRASPEVERRALLNGFSIVPDPSHLEPESCEASDPVRRLDFR
jgi:diguanylate cyclase (GGDEF)-like protein